MYRNECRRRGSVRFLSFESLEERRVLASVIVSNSSDDVNGDVTNGIAGLQLNPGTDGISLREAVLAAESGAGPDVIEFSTDPAHGLNDATITLTAFTPFVGALTITESVTIDATMLSRGITINAGHGTDMMPNTGDGKSVFFINAPGFQTEFNVTLAGLTITGGDAGNGDGGGILYRAQNSNPGTFTIEDCRIIGNAAVAGSLSQGGGVSITANGISGMTHVRIEGSDISDNTVGNFG